MPRLRAKRSGSRVATPRTALRGSVTIGRRGLVVGALTAVTSAPAHARLLTVDDTTAPPVRRGAAAQRLLVVGDSISQGSSGDFTWRYRLWRKLRATDPGAVAFVGPTRGLYDNVNDRLGSLHYAARFPGDRHAARWGASLSQRLPEVAGLVERSRATTMIVLLGANDLAFEVATPADVEDMLRDCVVRARTSNPSVRVVLCEVPSRYDVEQRRYVLRDEVADLARRLAKAAADLSTPTSPVVVAHVLRGWDPRVHTYDGTHPNPTGETLIAQRVSEALARLGTGEVSPGIIRRTPWRIHGPAPRVVIEPGSATLSWDRTSTGASGMLVEFRRADDTRWTRLPYAIGAAQHDTWSLRHLPGGVRHQFRLVPSKGRMTGLPGPVVERVVAPTKASLASGVALARPDRRPPPAAPETDW